MLYFLTGLIYFSRTSHFILTVDIIFLIDDQTEQLLFDIIATLNCYGCINSFARYNKVVGAWNMSSVTLFLCLFNLLCGQNSVISSLSYNLLSVYWEYIILINLNALVVLKTIRLWSELLICTSSSDKSRHGMSSCLLTHKIINRFPYNDVLVNQGI